MFIESLVGSQDGGAQPECISHVNVEVAENCSPTPTTKKKIKIRLDLSGAASVRERNTRKLVLSTESTKVNWPL